MKFWWAKLWQIDFRFHMRNIKTKMFSRENLPLAICQSFPPLCSACCRSLQLTFCLKLYYRVCNAKIHTSYFLFSNMYEHFMVKLSLFSKNSSIYRYSPIACFLTEMGWLILQDAYIWCFQIVYVCL